MSLKHFQVNRMGNLHKPAASDFDSPTELSHALSEPAILDATPSTGS
jgi:hypothetical protein